MHRADYCVRTRARRVVESGPRGFLKFEYTFTYNSKHL